MKFGLSRKFFLVVSTGVAILTLTMSLLVNRTVVREVQENEDQGLMLTRSAFEALQEDERSELLERCTLISELPYFKAAVAVYDAGATRDETAEAVATVSEVARRMLERVDVDLLVLTDDTGLPIIAVGPVAQDGLSHREPLVELARAAMVGRSADGMLDLGSGIVHTMAVPMDLGGRRLGTLCLGVRLDLAMAESLERMTASAVAVCSDAGVEVVSSGVPAAIRPALARAHRDLRTEGRVAVSTQLVEVAGDRYRTLWVPLMGPSRAQPVGAFVVLRSEDRALSFLAQVRRGLVTVAIMALLGGMAFSYFFSRQLTRPIRTLAAFADRIAEGDWQARVDIHTRDELAVLGDAFNRMNAHLGRSRTQLEETNRALEERGRALEHSNRELTLSRDETEAVNDALRETHAQLVQAGKMAAFGELGASIAHELRQPLTAIRGYAQLVEHHLPAEAADSRRHLGIIVSSVDHMTAIVQGLKDFARKSTNTFREVDANEAVRRTALLMSAQLKSRGITLTLDLEATANPIHGDTNQLQQVFTNLIGNARDAIGERRGHIRVETRTLGDGSYLLATVSDDGPGIPQEVISRIFQSFFTTKGEGEGTGLGLSITQSLVQDHGGRIEVSSPPEGGATFQVFLPTVLARPCWEMIDCVRDCRPEIASREACAVFRESRGHRCWIQLRQMGDQNPEISRPQCESCPVHSAKNGLALLASRPPRAA